MIDVTRFENEIRVFYFLRIIQITLILDSMWEAKYRTFLSNNILCIGIPWLYMFILNVYFMFAIHRKFNMVFRSL